jgi:ATP-dependent RNA helicase HelY
VATIELPTPYAPHSKKFLSATAELVRRTRLRPPPAAPKEAGESPVSPQTGAAAVHPCAACPDLRTHVRAAERADRLERDADVLERSIRGRTESLARQFDRVLRVLEAWGYVDGWALTEQGERLARLYHECDLLVAETLTAGLLDDLEPADVAGLVATFTYEPRGPGGSGPAPVFPSRVVRDRWLAIERLAGDINRSEQDAGLPPTRPPDAGFLALAHAWAAGGQLGHVLGDEDMSGGDFVRNVKQLLDLLRQVSELAPAPTTRTAARAATTQLFRGVVSASSLVTLDDDVPEGPG